MSAFQRFTAPVAVHLFLIREGRVLLLRRANTGYEDGSYSVIAGHLDGGEQVVAAAIREAREEAGIALARSAVSVVGVMHNRADVEYINFFLAAFVWSGEITNAEPHKCDELAWHPLADLPANTIPYVRRALDNYRRGIWFDSFGWEQQMMV
ncbi:MAG TPA: NUDIX domain-containing protein [Ktedonobacterales bacterium]|nr:NUDIX domain-containing protein [Ktedonobacterales bacterium]